MNDNNIFQLHRQADEAPLQASSENACEQVRALLDDAEADDVALPLLHRQEVWLRASLLCGFAGSYGTFTQEWSGNAHFGPAVLNCLLVALALVLMHVSNRLKRKYPSA